MKNLPLNLHIDSSAFEAATDKDKEYITELKPSTTFFKDGLSRFIKNKIALISFVVIAIITVSSIVIPVFWPYAYDQQLGISPGKPVDASYSNLSPFEYATTEKNKIEAGDRVFPHIFGTDQQGRDYFIRVVYGTRISLAVGFFASIIVLIIGLTVGSVAGFFGGKVDLVIMRIVDVIYSLPDMLMVILLSSVLNVSLKPLIEGTALSEIGTNIISLFIVFAVLYWVQISISIRKVPVPGP